MSMSLLFPAHVPSSSILVIALIVLCYSLLVSAFASSKTNSPLTRLTIIYITNFVDFQTLAEFLTKIDLVLWGSN